MRRARIALARFCGWDYVAVGLKGLDFQFRRQSLPDTAELKRKDGRSYPDEHTGPIMNWEDFEK